MDIPILSPEHQQNLKMPFTTDEIKEEAFEMVPTKAPWIDGKLALLYQKILDILGDLTTEAVFHFLNLGFFVKET